MGWLRNIFNKERHAPPPRRISADPMERFGESWAIHRDELASVPNPQRKQEILRIWREAIDSQAHDYADLVLVHPNRDQIMQLEVEAIMQAYLSGVMVQRGWVVSTYAEQLDFALGRLLRQKLAQLGVSWETVRGDYVKVINQALGSIVQLGIENGD